MGTMMHRRDAFQGLDHFDRLMSRGVGFDRLFESMTRALSETGRGGSYPPYDILETEENRYRIDMAIAGFSPDEITVEVANGVLTVKGEKTQVESSEGRLLHRGIANRRFEQTFSLAEHVRVGEAALRDGLLQIDLVRELPEALKPRMIPVGVAA